MEMVTKDNIKLYSYLIKNVSKDVAKKYMLNCVNSNMQLECFPDTYYRKVLKKSFYWRDTLEGGNFWQEIFNVI